MKTAAIVISLILSSVFGPRTYAHDGHVDPVLQELNDYLMAIQMLRIDDPEAAELFKSWQELRAESWKIRKLTDEEDLLMNSDAVFKQVSKTRAKQKQLLQDCHAYFAKMIQQELAIHFVVDQAITSIWKSAPIEVQVQHFKVLLIEVKNKRNAKVYITMQSNASDEILFWNKQFTIAPQTSRYTFAILAPWEEEQSENILQISDTLGHTTTAAIEVKGTPTKEIPYVLLPDEGPTRVVVPARDDTPFESDPAFLEAIKFSIIDKHTGKPMAARIEVDDSDTTNYWSPLRGPSYAIDRNLKWGWRTPLWDYQPGPYFYAHGEVELGVSPTGKKAKVYHGFEYRPATIPVPANGIVNVALERWINMPELGWFSGQTHIHTTDVGIPVQFTRFWPLVSQAEDLHVSAILTLKLYRLFPNINTNIFYVCIGDGDDLAFDSSTGS